MDHFENIAKILLENEGYWVRSSVKVNLTKEEKARTEKPTIPRPEIDLLAYRPGDSEIVAIEVKSFFDSSGVALASLTEEHDVATGKYKLLTSESYRNIVIHRLQKDLVFKKYLDKSLPVRLGLIAGNVKNGDEDAISQFAKKKGWFYWSPINVKERVVQLAAEGYENEAIYIAAKILLR